MKKSLRFTAAGLSICMMAAMLAGCSSSSSTDTTAAADASEAAADTQEAEAKTSVCILYEYFKQYFPEFH